MPSGVLGRDQWRLACLPCARALAQIPETKFQELKDLILSMTSTTSNRSGMPAIYGVVAAAEVERLKPLSELSDISAKGEVRGCADGHPNASVRARQHACHVRQLAAHATCGLAPTGPGLWRASVSCCAVTRVFRTWQDVQGEWGEHTALCRQPWALHHKSPYALGRHHHRSSPQGWRAPRAIIEETARR